MASPRHRRTDTVAAHVRDADQPWWRRSAVAVAVPLVVLGGGWSAVAMGGGGEPPAQAARSSSTGGATGAVDVPAVPFSAPAAPAAPGGEGADPSAPVAPGVAGEPPAEVVASLEHGGIPEAALTAYRRAQQLLGQAAPRCHLPWQLVAAIGRVESNHGRHGGNVLTAEGLAVPGVLGPRLDGTGGFARVPDTDRGVYDHDRTWDRAVGPMQFLPSTWRLAGVDVDGDGVANPQDINDASAATGRYLCAGGADLSRPGDLRLAVFRYNHSWSYVDLVLSVAQAYGAGHWAAVPDGLPAPDGAGSATRATTPASTAAGTTTGGGASGTAKRGAGSTSSGSGGSGGSAGSGGSTSDGGTTAPAPRPTTTAPIVPLPTVTTLLSVPALTPLADPVTSVAAPVATLLGGLG